MQFFFLGGGGGANGQFKMFDITMLISFSQPLLQCEIERNTTNVIV